MPLPTALAQAIDAAVEREAEGLLRLARNIHQHPELRFEETKAAAWITELLESRRHAVERGLGGLSTALRARAGKPDGPKVAILAEYDALPAIHPYLAIVNEGEAFCHEPRFAAAAGSDQGLQTALLAAKALARTAIEVIGNEALREAIQAEWSAQR